MNRKIISLKNLAPLLILSLTFFGLGMAMKRPPKELDPISTPKLSSYEWVLKIDGETDDEAFQRWSANDQIEIKGWHEQKTPEITYRLSARIIEGSQGKIQSGRVLKFQCVSQNEISEIQFDDNKPPATFEIHQRCGLRLWILKLRMI